MYALGDGVTDQTRGSHTGPPPGYMPQLDALRAFAVGAVMVHHFADVESLPFGLGQIPFGFLGVRLFFVLSGFLITGILLQAREAVQKQEQSPWFSMRQFYARRFLRIFPLYYFVVFVLLIVNIPPTRDVSAWLLTYTFNIQLSIQGWFPENISHFWTLSVEEQYYLIWPWLVLFVPFRRILPVVVVVILLGPAFRTYAVIAELNEVATYCFTLSSLDTLGMGSLLAILSLRWGTDRLGSVLDRFVLPAGLFATAILLIVLHTGIHWESYVVALDLSVGLIFCWLIFKASRGFRGHVGTFLTMKPLVYLGRITYGLYVYHLFVPLLVHPAMAALGLDIPGRGWANLVISSAVTVLVASLSWHILEKPLNDLKRLFPTSRKMAPAGTVGKDRLKFQ